MRINRVASARFARAVYSAFHKVDRRCTTWPCKIGYTLFSSLYLLLTSLLHNDSCSLASLFRISPRAHSIQYTPPPLRSVQLCWRRLRRQFYRFRISIYLRWWDLSIELSWRSSSIEFLFRIISRQFFLEIVIV